MAKNQTISAHVAATTVAKIDQLAKLENRSRSQMTEAVIELGGNLPHEAWSALFQVKALGTEENWLALQQDLVRTLLDHRYRLLQQRMRSQVDSPWLESLETEEDILAAALELTRNV